MPNEAVIGLDIGSRQIKAVLVERNRDDWILLNAAITATPPDAVQDGMILDIPRVTETVKALLRDQHFPATDTVGAVTGSHVMVRSVKMQSMSPANLRRSIKFEANKYLDQGAGGASIENSAVEFEVLNREGDQMDVLLVIAPNPMVDSRVAVIEGSGLEPVAVDVEAFALLRAVEAAGYLPPPEHATVAMNLGATFTDLNIIIGNRVAAPRSIPIGGNALTQSLASVLNVPLQQAEEQKRHLDLRERRDGAAPDSGSFGAADPARQVTVPFVDELIRELRRSIIYFQSQAAEAGMSVAVEQIVVSGGGVQLGGLAEYLAQRLDMEVKILDALEMAPALGPDAERWQGHGAELAVALGLALKDYE